jgi:hypothetical protein
VFIRRSKYFFHILPVWQGGELLTASDWLEFGPTLSPIGCQAKKRIAFSPTSTQYTSFFLRLFLSRFVVWFDFFFFAFFCPSTSFLANTCAKCGIIR